MLSDLKLKKCVINGDEFEFQYSRFGEQLIKPEFGEALSGYDLLLTIDTDLTDNERKDYITNMLPLEKIDVKTITFYDLDGTTVITTLTDYGIVNDLYTDLVNYQDETNYRGTIRFVKNIDGR